MGNEWSPKGARKITGQGTSRRSRFKNKGKRRNSRKKYRGQGR